MLHQNALAICPNPWAGVGKCGNENLGHRARAPLPNTKIPHSAANYSLHSHGKKDKLKQISIPGHWEPLQQTGSGNTRTSWGSKGRNAGSQIKG